MPTFPRWLSSSFSLTSACVFPRTFLMMAFPVSRIVTDCVPTLPASVLSFADISLPRLSSLWRMLSNQELQAGILSHKEPVWNICSIAIHKATKAVYEIQPYPTEQSQCSRSPKGAQLPSHRPCSLENEQIHFYHHARYDRPKIRHTVAKGPAYEKTKPRGL